MNLLPIIESYNQELDAIPTIYQNGGGGDARHASGLLYENLIKRTFKKALSWIRDFFGKIYKFISKSFKRVFDFMDIEPVVSADGIAPSTISWPN